MRLRTGNASSVGLPQLEIGIPVKCAVGSEDEFAGRVLQIRVLRARLTLGSGRTISLLCLNILNFTKPDQNGQSLTQALFGCPSSIHWLYNSIMGGSLAGPHLTRCRM